MQTYSTIVLFAGRHGRKVIDGATFKRLIQMVLTTSLFSSLKLNCKGIVFGPKAKKIAPRGGPWSSARMGLWEESVDVGCLVSFSLSSRKSGENERYPEFLLNLTNFGGDGPDKSDVSKDGYFEPPLSLTIAIPSAETNGSNEEWDNLCMNLAVEFRSVFGFMEQSRTWGIASGGGLTGQLMDNRGIDVPHLEYGSGKRGRMDQLVSRLRWRCILHKTHFKKSLSDLRAQSFVERVVETKSGIIFVAFKEDPEQNPDLARRAEPFFNFVPPAATS